MPETATRLPRARTPRNPVWLDAIDVYKRSFDATSAETLIDGAEAFAEMLWCPETMAGIVRKRWRLRECDAAGWTPQGRVQKTRFVASRPPVRRSVRGAALVSSPDGPAPLRARRRSGAGGEIPDAFRICAGVG